MVRNKANCRLSRPEFKVNDSEVNQLTCNLKGGGDKSMLVKREAFEGVYSAVPRHLSDMVKA